MLAKRCFLLTFGVYSPTLDCRETAWHLPGGKRKSWNCWCASSSSTAIVRAIEEIASGLGLASLATVHKHVQALEAKQYLRRNYNHSRSLEIGERYFREEKARQPTAEEIIPLLGRIAAGVPVEAIPSPESLHFSDFVGNESTFALQVRGESMIEDHICSGDFVLVEKADSVRNGEIVVALLDGSEATLKRYYVEPDAACDCSRRILQWRRSSSIHRNCRSRGGCWR